MRLPQIWKFKVEGRNARSRVEPGKFNQRYESLGRIGNLKLNISEIFTTTYLEAFRYEMLVYYIMKARRQQKKSRQVCLKTIFKRKS